MKKFLANQKVLCVILAVIAIVVSGMGIASDYNLKKTKNQLADTQQQLSVYKDNTSVVFTPGKVSDNMVCVNVKSCGYLNSSEAVINQADPKPLDDIMVNLFKAGHIVAFVDTDIDTMFAIIRFDAEPIQIGGSTYYGINTDADENLDVFITLEAFPEVAAAE